MKAENIVTNILEKSKSNDRDGDGVPNDKDCQPDNPFRQDKLGFERIQKYNKNLDKGEY